MVEETGLQVLCHRPSAISMRALKPFGLKPSKPLAIGVAFGYHSIVAAIVAARFGGKLFRSISA